MERMALGPQGARRRVQRVDVDLAGRTTGIIDDVIVIIIVTVAMTVIGVARGTARGNVIEAVGVATTVATGAADMAAKTIGEGEKAGRDRGPVTGTEEGAKTVERGEGIFNEFSRGDSLCKKNPS